MNLSTAVAAFCLSIQLFAGSAWTPVPPDVWAIKEGPKGAVILEDRMRFTYMSVEYVYRVRIFSEEGKGAAEIPDLPSTITSVKGRTVYPDGRQVEFNSRKDFAERKVEQGDSESRRTHLVAPGITADCVMELTWSEPADGMVRGLPHRYSQGLYSTWNLANRFPTQVLGVEVAQPFPLAWSLNPGGGAAPEVAETRSGKSLVFKNVPSVDAPPYSIRPTLRLPRLVIFWQPQDLRNYVGSGSEAYWNETIQRYYKPDYEDGIVKGGPFKALALELTANLPSSPGKAAMALMERLDGRIANLSHATFAESAEIPKNFWRDFESKDLAEAIKTRRTNWRGMRLLFYHMLKAADLNPVIAKVPDRDVSLFDWNHLNPWQFNTDLIGVEEPGVGMIWFDPTLRFATPGVVHPDYTAVPALIIDPRTWKGRKGSIEGLGANGNVRRFTYHLDLEEEQDRFAVDAEFAGYPEYVERDRYMALEPKEQSKVLKERFEKAMKNVAVESAEVRHTGDAKASVTWHVKASMERESGRRRLVDPFPGMPWPLWVPTKIEDARSALIVLPYLATQLGVSTFKVPPGYTMGAHQEIKQQNGFGRVFWVPSYDPATRMGRVVIRVEVAVASAAPSQWGAFKEFLGWIEDACRRQVTLSKEG